MIELIQRYFRLRRLSKSLKNFDFDNKINKHDNFDSFTKLIQKKEIILQAKNILNLISKIVSYHNCKPFNSRIFLSAFLINNFKDDVLSLNESSSDDSSSSSNNNSLNSLDELIYNLSIKVVNKFISLNENISFIKIRDFNHFLESYINIFVNWKEKDLEKILQQLTISYYDMENIITQLKNKKNKIEQSEIDYINILEDHKIDLKNKIIQLDGLDYFNQFKIINLSENNKLNIQVKQLLEKSFWDILSFELNSEPPIYNQLLNIYTEIRDLFCQLVPNREDIQIEIKDYLDPELLKNMLENNAFEDQDLYNLSVYIISLIKKFQPPVMDNEVNEWETDMKKQFENKFDYSDFLVIFFKSVYNMIYTIIDHIEKLKNLSSS